MSQFNFLKDLLFPKNCLGCKKLGAYICASCKGKLIAIKRDNCPYCNRASFAGLTHPACKRQYGLDGIKSIVHYDAFVKALIATIKYRLVTDAIDEFIFSLPANKMEEVLNFKILSNAQIIIPVPLHANRQKKRGFNHAEKMAKYFAQFLSLPMGTDLIYRILNTKPQATLDSRQDRHNNVRGAFAISNEKAKVEIAKGRFLILDDVWTSGSTVKEMGAVLKRHGASAVYGLTIAKAR